MLFRALLTIALPLSATLAWSADPAAPPAGADKAPSPATGAKAAEFAKIEKEWNELIANLGALKSQYATTTDAAKKAEIRQQYEQGVATAKAMEGKLVEGAASAYAEAPNTDSKITEILVATLGDRVIREDYETAFKIGKLLMDNKCPDKFVPALAGPAAYCVNEYDLAEPWLKAAQESGMLAKISKEMQRDYAMYPEMIDDTKAGWVKEKKIREAEAKADDLPRVLMKTSQGDIEIELFENEAPNTVLNFITLVEKGFYNGLKFHRVLPGFMAQGGDPLGTGGGGPGYTIPCECPRPDHRLHFRGSLSMAKKEQPDTGGSQFFLTFVPTKHLDGKHTVFGRVISGFDVLAKLKRRNPDDPTVGPADTIVKAEVTRKRNHPYDVKDLKKSGNTD